jgi:luciferase family oxidoreductase group 1
LIAEQFGTLASLYPGRIDLGLGRAPGSDVATARALRRDPMAGEAFPQDVAELMAYFHPSNGGRGVRAIPGEGLDVPIWILGSSFFGAQLAAAYGLPFAFAGHFAPRLMIQALEIYRSHFRPSAQLERPYAMAGVAVIAADTDEEARLLFSSVQQSFVALRRGSPIQLPPPHPGYEQTLTPLDHAAIGDTLSAAIVGGPETVRRGLDDLFARTNADEVIIATQIHDHAARLRSFEIVMSGQARPERGPVAR